MADNPMTERAPFAGGDQGYLRDDQYRDGSKLATRASLHHRFSTATKPLWAFIADQVPWADGQRVLDCGAGTGMLWQNDVAPRSLELTVTDLSPGMVDAAASAATQHGFENVRGETADIQQLPFADASFDLVFANHMLYHVPDPALALRETARVLAPGGALVASTNGVGHMAPLDDILGPVFGETPNQLYDVFGIDTGEALLRDVYRNVTWHAYDNELLVTDPAAVVEYLRTFPPGETATPDQVAAMQSLAESLAVDGTVRIRPRAGVFVAHTPR